MRVIVHAVGLLVVSGKVLDTCTHTVRLYTANVCSTGFSGHDRIFRIVLEITSAQRTAHYIHGRSQQDICSVFLDLLADRRSNLFYKFGIPG